jgi:hypothetical protein
VDDFDQGGSARGHTPENFAPSLLPFNPAELTAVRVRPADFARMCNVSKQCVSQWIKNGKITVAPDGKIDPVAAARQVFQNTDPGRLRARVFRSAMSDTDQLRLRIQQLEAQLATAKQAQKCMIHPDDLARLLFRADTAILERFDELVEARDRGNLDSVLDSITSPIFYPGADGDEI